MQLKNTLGLSVLLVSLFMTACESKDRTSTSITQTGDMMQMASTITSETKKVYLEGSIRGEKDGKVFTETFDKKSLTASLQIKGSDVVLNIASQQAGVMIIGQSPHGIGNYHGVGNYDEKELNIIKVEMNMKTMGVEQLKVSEKKVEITEDSDTDIKGTLAFKTKSQAGETHNIKGTFEFKKIIIDPNDQQALLQLIKRNKNYIGSASIALRKNKDFMQKAIFINASCFRYAGASLKKDKAFILGIVKEKPEAILMALDESLSKDKGFAMEMVKANEEVIYYLPSGLKKDKDVIAASKKKKAKK